ncbi:hypothetical protein KJ644_04565 [Candidatus Dependentiae bacterium]|nr:hypothetical protein [Candidatus Dependentiae bacterium]MBU4387712.1 hypothetical protein [Candidatus Dependentiae bacterium]
MFKRIFFIFIFFALSHNLNLNSMMVIDQSKPNEPNNTISQIDQIYSQIMMEFFRWNMSFCDEDEESFRKTISEIIKKYPDATQEEVVKMFITEYLVDQIYSQIMMEFFRWNMSFCDGDEESFRKTISEIIKEYPDATQEEVVKMSITEYLGY